MSDVDAATLRRALMATSAPMVASRTELNELAGVAGDGDLGESLATGFRAIEAALSESPQTRDVGAVLRTAGTALSLAAPSTFGTLLGMAWRDAGRALAGGVELDAARVVEVHDLMAAGIARRGNVVAGQRTVLDAVLAGREAAGEVVAAGGDGEQALDAAAAGAERGAARTKEMRAQVGRAGWIADRAHGHPDAGATAWALIARSLTFAAGGDER